jgi:hypothetical protein
MELLQQQNYPVTDDTIKKSTQLKSEIVSLVNIIRNAENALLDLSTEDMDFLYEKIEIDPLSVGNNLSFIADELEDCIKK